MPPETETTSLASWPATARQRQVPLKAFARRPPRTRPGLAFVYLKLLTSLTAIFDLSVVLFCGISVKTNTRLRASECPKRTPCDLFSNNPNNPSKTPITRPKMAEYSRQIAFRGQRILKWGLRISLLVLVQPIATHQCCFGGHFAFLLFVRVRDSPLEQREREWRVCLRTPLSLGSARP